MMTRPPARPRRAAERRFWLTALGLIVGFAAVTGLIILRGSTIGIDATTTPASGATISAKTLIGLTFATPMQPDSVESHLALDPPLSGRWAWDLNGSRSDRVVQFVPLQPLVPGQTYRATLTKGARAVNGRAVRHDVVWQFTIRPPSLLFLRAMPGGTPTVRNLWTANGDGSGLRQITNEQAGVLEFTTAPDGGRIAYTTPDQQRATALWAINLDGTGRTRLSPVGDPSIYASPAWSPAGDVIVYTLRSVVPTGAPPSTSLIGGASQPVAIGTSKLWAVAPDGRSLGRIYGRGDEVGFDPVWSPDGARLAFRGQVSDNNTSTVVLSDLSADPLSLPAGPGSAITWSPDSTHAAFDESVPDASGGTRPLLGNDAGHESMPAWSPDGSRLAFIRQNDGTPAADLWVAQPDGSGLTRLLGGDDFSSELPAWSPDGKTVVLARFNATSGEESAIWTVGADGQGARPLIPGGERVAWIP
ncbi:MAG: Ig-like domain-containing protein [Thermomicrobiales bacterium]